MLRGHAASNRHGACAGSASGPINQGMFSSIEAFSEVGADWIEKAWDQGMRGLALFVGQAGPDGQFRAMLMTKTYLNKLIRVDPRLYSAQLRARLRDADPQYQVLGVISLGAQHAAFVDFPVSASASELGWVLNDALAGDGAVS